MPGKKLLLFSSIAVLLVVVIGVFAYRHWHLNDGQGEREKMLSLMPEDASTVAYVDLAQLRATPVLAALFRWAPKPTIEDDYGKFLQGTGFNYETDLDRVALAIRREPHEMPAFAVAEGRFDRKKIESYASQYSSLKTANGKTLFAIPLNGWNRKVFFTFLRSDQIEWANESSFFFC